MFRKEGAIYNKPIWRKVGPERSLRLDWRYLGRTTFGFYSTRSADITGRYLTWPEGSSFGAEISK